MWGDRLLRKTSRQRGSAALESIFATVVLLVLALGVVEMTLVLYGRNVVAAAAHEGARAAIERGRDPAEAATIARNAVARSAGRIVSGLEVTLQLSQRDTVDEVAVSVTGTLRTHGPVSLPIPVAVVARSSRETLAP